MLDSAFLVNKHIYIYILSKKIWTAPAWKYVTQNMQNIEVIYWRNHRDAPVHLFVSIHEIKAKSDKALNAFRKRLFAKFVGKNIVKCALQPREMKAMKFIWNVFILFLFPTVLNKVNSSNKTPQLIWKRRFYLKTDLQYFKSLLFSNFIFSSRIQFKGTPIPYLFDKSINCPFTTNLNWIPFRQPFLF